MHSWGKNVKGKYDCFVLTCLKYEDFAGQIKKVLLLLNTINLPKTSGIHERKPIPGRQGIAAGTA